VDLAPGWNLVGFPDATGGQPLAFGILNALLGTTHGSYAEIDGYAGGQWTPSAYYLPANGPASGTNFAAQPGQGYALYTDTGATQTL
jgi:hypothetical protein